MNVIHSAPQKVSTKVIFGLQPSGFRLPQAETFFYWSQSNFLQYNNPLIKKSSENALNLRKSLRATRVRSLGCLEYNSASSQFLCEILIKSDNVTHNNTTTSKVSSKHCHIMLYNDRRKPNGCNPKNDLNRGFLWGDYV